MDVYNIHGLEQFPRGGPVSQREVKACLSQGQARAADDVAFIILIIEITEREDIHFVPGFFEGVFVQVNVGRDSTDVGLIGICHHSNSHGDMLRQWEACVKAQLEGVIKSKHACEIDFTRQGI